MRLFREEVTMKKILLVLFLISLLATVFFISEKNYLYAITAHVALASIAIYFIYRKDFATLLSDLGIPCGISRLLKYTILGLAVIFIGSIVISQVMMHFGLWDQAKVRERITGMPWYVLLLAVTIVPISEELFFRGLLLNKIGILPSSILFAAAHFAYGSTAEIIITFLIGLWFAYICKRSKSVLPTMVIHLIYNLLSISIMLLAARIGIS